MLAVCNLPRDPKTPIDSLAPFANLWLASFSSVAGVAHSNTNFLHVTSYSNLSGIPTVLAG